MQGRNSSPGTNTIRQAPTAERPVSEWAPLYRAGGAAALLAGILFRRNLAAEVGLFTQNRAPATVAGWFALLQSNRLLGLTYLNVFDTVNYALVAVTFLALYVALRRLGRSAMTVATALAFLGIAVYLAANTAFSMLSLSEQYAAATDEAQRATLLAAGQALVALNRFSDVGSHPGSAGYASLLLIAMAGIITSVVMLRTRVFSPATGYVGLLAGALDLAYCLAYAFIPAVDTERLALLFIPAAGLGLMIWHILVGWRLYRLGGETRRTAVPS